MKAERTAHRIAIAINGLAVTAAAMRCPIPATLLLALSSFLLIWTLERFRSALARETRS